MANLTKSSAAAQRRAKTDTEAAQTGEDSNAETLAVEISQENAPDNAVVQHLQRQVANAFVLYANYKHYHWQTYG
ncbi:MAG: hypothetical protein H0W99_01265, partial [Acidobacteria bacterium]|nr:hypothetical protein [Acidobacteriota bacterium]